MEFSLPPSVMGSLPSCLYISENPGILFFSAVQFPCATCRKILVNYKSNVAETLQLDLGPAIVISYPTSLNIYLLSLNDLSASVTHSVNLSRWKEIIISLTRGSNYSSKEK